jgi:copper chaperone NosL
MRTWNLFALIIIAALVSACAASAEAPPEIQVDRSACDHCTMLISEARYAAAYRMEGSEPRVFDDIGCLLGALDKETTAPAHTWFMDANDATWIDGTKAVFVRSDEIRTPMSGGLTAYKDVASAEAAAARFRGSVVRSFADLRSGK